jgi:hypothetical protein
MHTWQNCKLMPSPPASVETRKRTFGWSRNRRWLVRLVVGGIHGAGLGEGRPKLLDVALVLLQAFQLHAAVDHDGAALAVLRFKLRYQMPLCLPVLGENQHLLLIAAGALLGDVVDETKQLRQLLVARDRHRQQLFKRCDLFLHDLALVLEHFLFFDLAEIALVLLFFVLLQVHAAQLAAQTHQPAAQRGLDRRRRAGVELLKRRQQEARGPLLGRLADPLQRLVAVADILGNREIERLFVGVHLGRQPVRLPALEHLAPLGVGHVLFRRANDQFGEFGPAPSAWQQRKVFFEGAEVDVVVEEPHQVLEPAVVVLPLVRRRRQEQERLAVFGQADVFGQLVVLGLLGLARAIVDRAKPMGFVEDDQVPLAVFEEEPLVLLALEPVERRDGLCPVLPDARIDRVEVAAKDFEGRAELVLHFLLPLRRQSSRCDDQGALGLPALMERLPDHAGFDGLAQAHFIGEQEPPPRTGNDAMGRENLVRQNLSPRVGKLPALVAGQQPGREHLQLKAPRGVPLAAGGAVQRGIDLFQFGERMHLRVALVGRGHEDRRRILHPRDVVLDSADATDPVLGIQAVSTSDCVPFSQWDATVGQQCRWRLHGDTSQRTADGKCCTTTGLIVSWKQTGPFGMSHMQNRDGVVWAAMLKHDD